MVLSHQSPSYKQQLGATVWELRPLNSKHFRAISLASLPAFCSSDLSRWGSHPSLQNITWNNEHKLWILPSNPHTLKQPEILPSLTLLHPTIWDTSSQSYSLSSWGKVLGDPQPFLQQGRSNTKLTSETLRMSVRKRPRSSATQRPQLQEEESEATEGAGLSKVT